MIVSNQEIVLRKSFENASKDEINPNENEDVSTVLELELIDE